MSKRTLVVMIWAGSALLAVAWLWEAFTRGRGFISTYLAPFAIAGNMFAAYQLWKKDLR